MNANRDADRPCGSSYDERTDYRSGRFRQVGQPVDDDADTKVDLIGIEFRLASTQAAVPKMLARGSGSALLTGGAFALQPRPEYLSLSIGKVGIRALSQGIFETFKEKSVHVATVTVAGFVNTTEDATTLAEHFWQPSGSQGEVMYSLKV